MHKLVKFSFNSIINYFKAMQIFLISLALLTIVDFILSMLGIKLPAYIQIIFDFIYKLQSLIYKPNMSVIPVDFTLIVAAIEMMLLAGLIVYILNFIIEFEQICDKIHKDGQRRYENKFNKQLANNAKKIESKFKTFAMLYKIELEEYNSNYDFGNVSADKNALTTEYQIQFKNLMKNLFFARSQQTEYGILLFFDKLEQSNQIFEKIYEFSAQSKETLKKSKLRFRLKVAICVADEKTKTSEYLPKLNKLIGISVPNKIMMLGNFKIKYESLKDHTFLVTGIGDYSFENETFEVYTLEKH